MIMTSSQRVFINTIAQYGRTLINMFLTLYTVRLVLNSLGAQDFGIYTLIAGVISMLSFVTNSLMSTTQRFISFYQGKNNSKELKSIFNSCLFIHIIFGLLIVCILGLIYPFVFTYLFKIPECRLSAAKTVYLIVLLVLFFTFVTSPFKALLVSHENIVYTSIVDILDAILKLFLVFVMILLDIDKLIFYAFSMLIIQVVSFLLLSIYSKLKYSECSRISFNLANRKVIKEIFSFAGWTFYSTGCYVGQKEGIAIVINRIFGTIANAGYGIGFQVAGYSSVLAGAISNAIRPQITKAEGSCNREKALWLSSINSKMVFYLTSMVCIPCSLEIDQLLTLWLGKVPEFSNVFCVMAMLSLIADSLTTGLSTMNSAIGKIAKYTLLFATPKLLVCFIAYILLIRDLDIKYIAAVYVFVELLMALCRIPYMKYAAGLNVNAFFKNVLIKEIVPFTISTILCVIFVFRFDFEYRFLVTSLISFLSFILTIFFYGLTNQEKKIIMSIISSIKAKLI